MDSLRRGLRLRGLRCATVLALASFSTASVLFLFRETTSELVDPFWGRPINTLVGNLLFSTAYFSIAISIGIFRLSGIFALVGCVFILLRPSGTLSENALFFLAPCVLGLSLMEHARSAKRSVHSVISAVIVGQAWFVPLGILIHFIGLGKSPILTLVCLDAVACVALMGTLVYNRWCGFDSTSRVLWLFAKGLLLCLSGLAVAFVVGVANIIITGEPRYDMFRSP